MTDDCRQGEHPLHHHHHTGIVEGMPRRYVHKLKLTLGLSIFYLLVLVAGSILSGSLALMADAGHKLMDVLSITIALSASMVANWPPTQQKSFGFYRFEILAALLNGSSLFLMALWILWEAYQRSISGERVHIEGGIMLAVSVLGLIVNILAAWLLFPERGANLNVRGALFHVFTDILDSLGTIITAIGIVLMNWVALDTIVSSIIALLVMVNAVRLFKSAFHILMEAAPKRVSVRAIEKHIEAWPGVLNAHDIHCWTITTGKDALMAHVQVDERTFLHDTARALEADLRECYDLCHITIQLEPPGYQEEAAAF